MSALKFINYTDRNWESYVKKGDVVLLRDFQAINPKAKFKNPEDYFSTDHSEALGEDYLVGIVDESNKYFIHYVGGDKTLTTDVANYFSTFSFAIIGD